jgi:hypothetical protein
MQSISLTRLYVLRAMYLLIVLGLGATVWPGVLRRAHPWELMEGTVACMLVSFSALSALGLRYPLQMLPLLLWELAWKTVWLAIVALPQWWAGYIDESIQASVFACSFVVLVYLAIPWDYVYHHYIRQPGQPWLGARERATLESAAPR